MKKTILLLFFSITIIGYSQETETENESIVTQFLNNLTGSFESNAQWYTNDKELGDFSDPNFPSDDEPFRANSYLRLDYNFLSNFSVGVQFESYEPLPLLNYYTGYKGTDIATYYANYKNDKLDVTAGHFYEQFGSGLLLRAFEERQLGLNNALRGGRIKYAPTEFLNFTALYGQPRIGFKTSDSEIFGFDTNIDLSNALKIENISTFNLGLSYVGKNESFIPQDANFDTSDFPEMVHSYAARVDLDFGKFYTSAEYSIKGKDAIYTPASAGIPEIIEGEYFDGNALLVNLGYTKKGLGISGTLRRMENMAFFSERGYSVPGNNNFNMLSTNYVPALTKQQDYSLANIYIYQAQPTLQIQDFAGQAGEIGGQFDVFYKFNKESTLGGKYGTKVSANFSYWALLDATFDQNNSTYNAEFLKFGSRLNRDFNLEIRKKLSKNWSGIFTYINTIIDKGVTLGGPLGVQGDIKSSIIIAEATHKIGKGKSIRVEAQHLSTKQDNKNWAGATIEYNATNAIAFYVNDAYNYGNDVKDDQIHYYNIGGSYTKGASRVALNYGRQRGGLLCVGGVCRFVPENTGLTVNLTTSF
jgi:hypothetical protein